MQVKVTNVWLDCDPGLDDTFAIIYAALDKKLNLVGVSTSPGNTCLKNTTQNALDVLYNIGRSNVPVFAGSNILIKGEKHLAEHMHGSNGLGGVQLPTSPVQACQEHSFYEIYKRIEAQEGTFVWANTGSLTNLCILLLAYPDVKQKISKIVMMGGAIGRGNITPAAQFNVFFDPQAFQDVLRLKCDIPLVMIPLEVTHQNMATQEVFDHLEKNRHIPFALALYNMLVSFRAMYFNNYKFPYPPIHDPLTIFYILHPEQIETSNAIIDVDTFPVSYGRTNCRLTNLQSADIMKSIDLVAVNLKNDKIKFWTEMYEILDRICTKEFQQSLGHSK